MYRPMNRSRGVFARVSAVAVLVWALGGQVPAPAQASDALGYVPCETGLSQPDLEGGDTELELVDVNGDGHVDLLSVGDHGNPLINTAQEGILVWLGDGHGSWTHVHAGHLGYGGIAVGDVNGDGLQDVGYGIHHNYADNDLGDQILEVALGNGTGFSWTPWDDGLATHGENWGMFSSDFADVDADGDLDIGSMGFGSSSGLQVYLNDMDGTWRRSFGFLAGNSYHVFAFGDADGDGHSDIVTAKEEGTVWLGDGDGFFTQSDGNLPPPSQWDARHGPSFGDVDEDGLDDLAYCDTAGNAQVWLSRGPSSWQDVSAGIPATGTCEHTALADMDGDGHVDLVTFGDAELHVFGGDGTGSTWPQIGHHSTPDDPGRSRTLRVGGDIDHNGLPDVALVNQKRFLLFDTRNILHAYCESSVASELSVRVVQPEPNRRLLAGSTRFIEWAAGVPAGLTAAIDIELSIESADGPWEPVASDLPNGGRYQWIVPNRISSQAWLRITARTGSSTTCAVSREPFTIARRPDPLRLTLPDEQTIAWTDDLARDRYNLYRGSGRSHLETGHYTQDPAVEPGAAQFCALEGTSHSDAYVPPAVELTYYLVTAYHVELDGTDPEVPVPMAEGPLGHDSSAVMRQNSHRCPE